MNLIFLEFSYVIWAQLCSSSVGLLLPIHVAAISQWMT